MNVEKIKCLLSIYKEDDLTATWLARKMNVSKATMSRILVKFYQEGWLNQQGKCQLSSLGKEVAQGYDIKINRLTSWVQEASHLSRETAYQEAMKMVAVLDDETVDRIVKKVHMNSIFDKLENIVKFSGNYLENHLDDGLYHFSFAVYKKENHHVLSMAHQAFLHPGHLLIEKGRGYFIFTPQENTIYLEKHNLTVAMKVTDLFYNYNNKYHKCLQMDENFYIPITDLDFMYTREERLIDVTVNIAMETNMENIHQVKKEAILKILFH